MTSVIFEEQLELPLDIRNFSDFRKWGVSEEFPEKGRIDFVGGDIEVDMPPGGIYSQIAVKVEISRALANVNKARDLGELYSDGVRSDGVRHASPAAHLSAEPDMLFFNQETHNSNRAKLIPKSRQDDLFIEVEGAPDMVGDGPVSNDTHRLPAACYRAGVHEYWPVDARNATLFFQIHSRENVGFVLPPLDDEGFHVSPIFGKRFRLNRSRDRRGRWEYEFLSIPLQES